MYLLTYPSVGAYKINIKLLLSYLFAQVHLSINGALQYEASIFMNYICIWVSVCVCLGGCFEKEALHQSHPGGLSSFWVDCLFIVEKVKLGVKSFCGVYGGKIVQSRFILVGKCHLDCNRMFVGIFNILNNLVMLTSLHNVFCCIYCV